LQNLEIGTEKYPQIFDIINKNLNALSKLDKVIDNELSEVLKFLPGKNGEINKIHFNTCGSVPNHEKKLLDLVDNYAEYKHNIEEKNRLNREILEENNQVHEVERERLRTKKIYNEYVNYIKDLQLERGRIGGSKGVGVKGEVKHKKCKSEGVSLLNLNLFNFA